MLKLLQILLIIVLFTPPSSESVSPKWKVVFPETDRTTYQGGLQLSRNRVWLRNVDLTLSPYSGEFYFLDLEDGKIIETRKNYYQYIMYQNEETKRMVYSGDNKVYVSDLDLKEDFGSVDCSPYGAPDTDLTSDGKFLTLAYDSYDFTYRQIFNIEGTSIENIYNKKGKKLKETIYNGVCLRKDDSFLIYFQCYSHSTGGPFPTIYWNQMINVEIKDQQLFNYSYRVDCLSRRSVSENGEYIVLAYDDPGDHNLFLLGYNKDIKTYSEVYKYDFSSSSRGADLWHMLIDNKGNTIMAFTIDSNVVNLEYTSKLEMRNRTNHQVWVIDDIGKYQSERISYQGSMIFTSNHQQFFGVQFDLVDSSSPEEDSVGILRIYRTTTGEKVFEWKSEGYLFGYDLDYNKEKKELKILAFGIEKSDQSILPRKGAIYYFVEKI